MSKYDRIKFLKEIKANKPYICDDCGEEIRKDDTYYRESIGRINSLGVRLKKFCYKCGKKSDKRKNSCNPAI